MSLDTDDTEPTVTCPACKGTLHIFEPTWNPVALPCPTCKEAGRVPVSEAPPTHGEDVRPVSDRDARAAPAAAPGAAAPATTGAYAAARKTVDDRGWLIEPQDLWVVVEAVLGAVFNTAPNARDQGFSIQDGYVIYDPRTVPKDTASAAGAPGRAAPEPDIPNHVDAAVDRAVAALDGLTKAQQRDALALIEHWIALDRRAAFTVRADAAPPGGQP